LKLGVMLSRQALNISMSIRHFCFSTIHWE